MRYPPHILEEIRARLNVSDVVGRTIALKKKGREFAGLSPFKTEKTPSFFVNDQKGFYHCFASGEHGDIFTFLMKVEGLSFPEAVERLAGEAGVDLPKRQAPDPERESERERLLALHEATAKFFTKSLTAGTARTARAYLEGRGLSRDTIDTFAIGFAPSSRTALTEHLLNLGFKPSELVKGGVQIAGEDIRVPYDRFRNRIMFPIADARGRIVAFGGRALDADQPAKYLNSPETPIFHKGHLLFNAHRARQAAHDSGELLVVEGYMDVIALAQAGLNHAVAPLGTALTGEQVTTLWRMCPEPTLCFDGDEAGRRAAYRAIDTALPLLKAGYSLHFAFLPKGMDPDDLVRGEGLDAMNEVLDKRQSLVETLWQREWEAADWSTPERRAKLENQLRNLVRAIQDPGVRNHYGRIIAEKLRAAWEPAPAAPGTQSQGSSRSFTPGPGRRGGRSGGRGRQGDRFTPPAFAGHSASLRQSTLVAPGNRNHSYRETLILRTLINHPWLIEDAAEELAALELHSPQLSRLRDALLEACADEKNLDTATLRNHLLMLGYAPHLEQAERLATHRCDAFAEPDADRVDVENGWRHILALHQQQALKDQLAEAEREFRVSGDEDVMSRIMEIQRLIATIVPNEASYD
jgi:DNA primase